MAKVLKIETTDQFEAELAAVRNQQVIEHIARVISQLQIFPDSGSTQPREVLIERYGEGIRTRAIDRYVLVYRHDDEKLTLIALPWGPMIV